jgi:superfamily I DNA/RNA helicase
VFRPTLEELESKDSWTWGHICRLAREAIEKGDVESRYDALVVDEVQDLTTEGIKFLAAVPRKGLSHFMIVGDAGQRIYPGGFSLRSMGIETRGRSHRLNINYRTTHDIERAAARLRATDVDDLEGEVERESATQSLLRGPPPVLHGFAERDDECEYIADAIEALIHERVRPKEIAVFARTWGKLSRFRHTLRRHGIPASDRREDGVERNEVVLSTMHGAKGLEFRYVFVVGCDNGSLPLKSAIKAARGTDDVEVVTGRERNLLYVAMTRPRERVCTGDRSGFLDSIEPLADAV